MDDKDAANQRQEEILQNVVQNTTLLKQVNIDLNRLLTEFREMNGRLRAAVTDVALLKQQTADHDRRISGLETSERQGLKDVAVLGEKGRRLEWNWDTIWKLVITVLAGVILWRLESP